MIERKGYVHDYEKNFLKEKTKTDPAPHNQKGPRAPRSILPKVSAKRKETNKTYESQKNIWRKERKALDGFKCEFVDNGIRCPKGADRNPHHRAKRGRNLCDRRHFMAVCLPHHEWIEANKREAETRGYILRQYTQVRSLGLGGKIT